MFDTETTGLRPSAGDEIVSVGAVRIVNGRLLEQEVFDQLVDPRRPMSAESEQDHRHRERDAGEPTDDKVLPAFRAFCEDTVLVARNAAFDMRFLHMKKCDRGALHPGGARHAPAVRRDHPELPTHGLEAIAERLGVNPIGRHTAVGDAIVTAEVFLRMIPLLAQQGIRTLGEARAASRRTYFARIEY
ncbi:MAG: 3'-5' exonuclease [Burkholderiales bacterium]